LRFQTLRRQPLVRRLFAVAGCPHALLQFARAALRPQPPARLSSCTLARVTGRSLPDRCRRSTLKSPCGTPWPNTKASDIGVPP
jgi:hypothetical protein